MIFAAIVYVVDALIFGEYVIAGLVALVTLVPAVSGVVRGQGLAIAKALVGVGMAACVWGTVRANNTLARHRAHQIVAACDAFSRDQGRLPDSLAQLVPRYLPSVPLAKYTLLSNRFFYFAGERHSLMWVETPPFGRPTYSFEERRWGYLD